MRIFIDTVPTGKLTGEIVSRKAHAIPEYRDEQRAARGPHPYLFYLARASYSNYFILSRFRWIHCFRVEKMLFLTTHCFCSLRSGPPGFKVLKIGPLVTLSCPSLLQYKQQSVGEYNRVCVVHRTGIPYTGFVRRPVRLSETSLGRCTGAGAGRRDARGKSRLFATRNDRRRRRCAFLVPRIKAQRTRVIAWRDIAINSIAYSVIGCSCMRESICGIIL